MPEEPNNIENTYKMNTNKSRRSRYFKPMFYIIWPHPALCSTYLLFLGQAPSCPWRGLLNSGERVANAASGRRRLSPMQSQGGSTNLGLKIGANRAGPRPGTFPGPPPGPGWAGNRPKIDDFRS
jgi:hypothetical protein